MNIITTFRIAIFLEMKYLFLWGGFLLLIFLFPNISRACTVFSIDKKGLLVTGRSYDWSFGEGIIVINKRGQSKTALKYWEESSSGLASWTSKYGSITFVQYGREIAFDGMNEAGLVVSELWLEESQYPPVDSRPSISLDQYVQYLLDNFKTIDEIIASDALVRLRPLPSNFTKIHFFATDSAGNSIVIEFLNGKMVYHTKDSLPAELITNNTYESSINYINRGAAPNPISYSSLERFYRACTMIADYNPDSSGNIIPYTFKILDAVKQGNSTKFQTAFDIKNRVIYFKSQQNRQLRYFRFDAFDFSCQTVSKMLDINSNFSGDVTNQFIDYTWQANETLIKTAWEGLGTTNVYLPALQLVSLYPGTFKCTGATDVNEYENRIHQKIKIEQNYPNPFNPSTTIKYILSKPSQVTLTIYNMLGQIIRTLQNSFLNAGEYSLNWDATDDNNNLVSSAIYFFSLTSGEINIQKKMILVR